MKTRTLTHARLLELLHYDPDTGYFTWTIDRRKIKAGSLAGRTHKAGYRVITVENVRQYAHRLAWLYMTGEWPTDQIDHKNTDKSDNHWSNLRAADGSENLWNVRGGRGMSGIKGVQWHKKTGAWRARCVMRGTEFTLGYFQDPELAELVIMEFRESNQGEFARHS